MAAKGEVKIRLTLDDGSTILATRKEIDRLNLSMEQTNATAKKTVVGGNTVKRNLEGVGQRASNTSKDFSRMSQGMGGLVQAYATVAANVFALSTAFNVLSAATNFQDMISSARNLSSELGTSFLTTAVSIQKATKAQIDFRTALRAANKASASGISAENVTKFAEAAAKSAQTFGGTTTDALNRMVTAILQGETELLKEVGIVISSNEAFLQYGITIGKAANQLTSFEKRQALSNAVLKESDRLFAGTEIQVNNYEVLAANLQDAAQEALNFVNNSLGISSVIGAIADSIPLMAAGVGIFANSIISKLVPSVDSALEKAKQAGARSTEIAQAARIKAIEAEKGAGIRELELQKKIQDKKTQQLKDALAKRLTLLKEQGKIQDNFFRKGSTLDKASRGEDITERGVNTLVRKNVALAPRRKTKSDVGLTSRISKQTAKDLDALAKSTAEATKRAQELEAAQRSVTKSTRTWATTVSLGRQQLIASNQSTKAAILTATQGASVWEFYGKAVLATRKSLAKMSLDAKSAGLSLTVMQKAGARAALTTSLLGKAISTAFRFLTGAIIVVETASFALEALGINLFKTSQASKEVEEATETMSKAFKESDTTLSGMIKSFERFDELSSDLAFQKTSIAVGNLVQELASNFGVGVDTSLDKLNAMISAQKAEEASLDSLKKKVQAYTDAQYALFAAVNSKGNNNDQLIEAAEAVTKLQASASQASDAIAFLEDRASNSIVSPGEIAALSASAVNQLKVSLEGLSDSGSGFPILEKLKELPIIVKELGSSSATSISGLIDDFDSSIAKAGRGTIEYVEKLAELRSQLKSVGVAQTAAGEAIKELNAQVVLFNGTGVRLDKQVFGSENITNYAKLLETATKSIASLESGSTRGLQSLADALNVDISSVRAQVEDLVEKLINAGDLTLDRDSAINTLKAVQARSSTEQALLGTYKEQLKQVQLRETLELSILDASLQNLKAKRDILSKTDNKNARREVQSLNAQILAQEKLIELANKRRKSAAFAASEQASIRQNARETANLKLQILSAEQKIALAIGDTAEAAILKSSIEEAQLTRKKLDLELDRKALQASLAQGEIQKERFERDSEILKQRERIIGLQEKELRLQQQLRSGEETFKSANSRVDSSGQKLTDQEILNSFMIEGANKFLEEIRSNNPLKSLSDGVLAAMDNAVNSLVSTIGTGEDDFKGVLQAVETTLHSAILDSASQAIRQELAKLLFGDTLKVQSEQAAIASEQHLAKIAQNTSISSTQGGEKGFLDTLLSAVGLSSFQSTDGMVADVINDPTLFADGGVVHKPTFSMIGEGKNSEAVVPLPNNREIPVRLEGGGGSKTQVTNNFDFSGADAQTENRLRSFVQENRKGAFSDVFNEINRGGRYAKLSGRRK